MQFTTQSVQFNVEFCLYGHKMYSHQHNLIWEYFRQSILKETLYLLAVDAWSHLMPLPSPKLGESIFCSMHSPASLPTPMQLEDYFRASLTPLSAKENSWGRSAAKQRRRQTPLPLGSPIIILSLLTQSGPREGGTSTVSHFAPATWLQWNSTATDLPS